MKKLVFILVAALSTHVAFAADTDSTSKKTMEEKFTIPVSQKWNMQILGLKNFYPTYLADPLGVRFNVNSQKIRYGDIDIEDEVNSGNGYLGKLIITPGVRLSLLKFTPKKNPKLGIEADLGFTIPTFMRAGNHDVIGLDGVYYFAIAGRPTEWLALRASKHHICTHIGDEYPNAGVKSPIDFDPAITMLPVRDDFTLGAAAKPLHFLEVDQWNILQVYGELGFFWPGVDFLGTRQNKPHRDSYMHYQYGIEAEYMFKNKYLGGVFTGYNVTAYQLNAYAPNTCLAIGYIIPQDREEHKLRMGISFYNGRPLSNQFYNRKEKYTSFILSMDL